MALDLHGFEVPETPYRPSEIPNQLYERKLQQQRYDYMLQKDKEADEWKKMNLIQDLTDLSKHQTSSDVANAIGNTVAGNVLQKYTELAKHMSPTELQANIQREMSGVMNGMDATRNELDNSDEALKVLKQAHPELDISSLAKDLRADVLNRRINHDSFVNPLEVKPSQVQLDNPDFLSRYVTHTKGLDDEIQNPKGLDPITVVSGDPYTNVEYSTKVPPWMQTNYDESKMKNGFLPKGFMPQLSIKSEELPTDFLPALKGQQRKIVTHDVWQDFASKHPLQLIAGTRQMFPNYDQMSEGEKELAQRDYLYGKIHALDKSQFSYKSSKTPSVSQQKFWIGGTGGNNSGVDVNNVYGRIYNTVHANKEKGLATRFNSLNGDEQSTILDFVNKGRGEGEKFGASNVFLHENDNGQVEVYKVNDEGKLVVTPYNLLTTLNYTGTNLGKQPNSKSKSEVVRQGNNQQSTTNKKGEFDDLH